MTGDGSVSTTFPVYTSTYNLTTVRDFHTGKVSKEWPELKRRG